MDDQQVTLAAAGRAPSSNANSQANSIGRGSTPQQRRDEDRIKLLAPLFGHSKARLLVTLQTPATTTELAKRTHATPSAVSQLLHRLLAVGLLRQKRRGREVFYRLSPRGIALMNLFDDDALAGEAPQDDDA